MALASSWRNACPNLRVAFLLTLAALVAVLAGYSSFLRYIDSRPGIVLDDPVLRWLSPRDCSTGTFLLIYGCLVAAVIRLAGSPGRLTLALMTYTVMVVLRIGAMYLVPLDPPAGLIVLRDPFVEVFGPGAVLTRDLFFSGHTATLAILCLTASTTVWRVVFGVTTLLVAFLLLWQHAHYSIDVVAAPFFAYAAFIIAGRVFRLMGNSLDGPGKG
jgi:PAP2 superfamily C-terminal